MTRQPSGRSMAALDLLFLATARLGLAGVPGAQEDREAGDGVAQERGGDATGRRGQPAADEPDPDRQDEQVAVASRRPEPRRQRVQQRLDDVRRGRSSPVDSSSPKIAPRKVTSSMNAVAVELSNAPGYDQVSGKRMR